MITTSKMALATLALLLVGCGVDGAPIRPSLATGVNISSNGVHVGGRVGAHKGPVSISVGF